MTGFSYYDKHKVFISYYHFDDQKYKESLDSLLGSRVINKSVEAGEYDSDNSDEYVKRLIRDDKISDSSVIIVLVGPNTKTRKHVDWEIYAGLRESVNGNSGLFGILLPTFPLSWDGKYHYDNIPARLADNIKSGYAEMYTWEYARAHIFTIIDTAFSNRISLRSKIDNSRLQMQQNR